MRFIYAGFKIIFVSRVSILGYVSKDVSMLICLEQSNKIANERI